MYSGPISTSCCFLFLRRRMTATCCARRYCRSSQFVMVEVACVTSRRDIHGPRYHSGTGGHLAKGCDAVTSADGLGRGSYGLSTTHTGVSLSEPSPRPEKSPERLLFLRTMLRRCCRASALASGSRACVNGSGTGDDGPERGLSPQKAREYR